MLETYIRPYYQFVLVDPLAKLLAKRCLPEQITYAACLIGIVIIPLLWLDCKTAAVVVLLISGYLDTLDGTIARISNNSSDGGTILDMISDRIVEFAIIFGLFLVDPEHRAVLCLLMLGSCFICITSFLGVGIFTPNYSRKGFFYSPGIIERAEAFIFFILMILYPSYFVFLSIFFSTLVMLTSYLRIKQFIKK